MSEQNSEFTGWAKVELMGHNVEVGYVTTRYFGTAALLQIDVPGVDEHEETLESPEYVANDCCPVGTVVKRPAIASRSSMVGPSTIYRLTPCSEEMAKRALAERRPRAIAIVSMAPSKTLLPGETEDDDQVYDDEGEEASVSSIL